MAAPIGRLSLRKPRKGARRGREGGYVNAFTNCRGDEDIDAKRSRPSIGKPVLGHCEERARGFDWDRSADHIRASGQTVALKGRIHDRTRTLRRKSDSFPLHRGRRPYMALRFTCRSAASYRKLGA